MIQEKILELTEYGLVTGLVAPEDKRFTINRLLELFQLDELEDEVAAAYEKREPMTQETAEDADILMPAGKRTLSSRPSRPSRP